MKKSGRPREIQIKQSNYFLIPVFIRNKYWNQSKNCRIYPGADVDGVHNLVVMSSQLKFKKLKKRENFNKLDTAILRDKKFRDRFRTEVENRLKLENNTENPTASEEYNRFIDIILENAEMVIKK